MTIIVAALFLPQGPLFDTDTLDESLLSNLDQSLINIDQEQWNNLRAASPVYNNTIQPVKTKDTPTDHPSLTTLQNTSQDSLLENYTLPRIKSTTAIDELLTSDEFIANLTSKVSTPIPLQEDNTDTTSNSSFYRIGGKKNISVHDFFKVKKSLSNNNNTTSSPSPAGSLLKSTLKHSMSSGVVPTTTTHNKTFSKDKQKNKHHEEQQQQPVVPKFGGFKDKKLVKLKTTMMLYDPIHIFQNIPWKLAPQQHCNVSLRDILYQQDNINWVGTMGVPIDHIPTNILNEIQVKLETDHNCYAILAPDSIFNSAYFTFCKQTLWPILHYQVPSPSTTHEDENITWNNYVKLNTLIANQCIKLYNPGDIIWIHDYHLMLVPQLIRAQLPLANIAFFHHVSFPSSELFRCLAHRNEILKGILGANFVAFQTLEYTRHFLQTCNRILMADVTIPDKEIQYRGQIIELCAIPMGVDPFNLQSRVINDPRVAHWRKLIQEKWDGMKLILSRDSLDNFSGLVQKLKSYEIFLKSNPECIGKITLLQIVNNPSTTPPPNSVHNDLKRRVMIIIDRINSLSININIPPPVMFLQQDLDSPQLLALYCETDLYWVNSLREGMNLSCHEFITCSMDKHSPLMISEFTGSASIFQNDAILINPWDLDHVAKMIKYTLFDMSPILKTRKWKQMMKHVINNDSQDWLDKNLINIHTSWDHIQERTTLDKISYDMIMKDYINTHKHFFLFKISSPPTSHMLSIINDLANAPNKNNIVYIMNSFSKTTLETLYSRVTNIGLIAENGAYIKLLNGSWYNIVDNTDWKSEVIKILDDKVERLPGSYYKIYDSMIVFHTENAEDKDRTPSVIGDAMQHINTMFNESNVHAFVTTGNNVLYVQQSGLSLKAFNFILRFYNSFNEEELSSSPTTATGDEAWQTANESENESVSTTTQHNPIDFACITGSSSPIIDPIFEFVKKELDSGELTCGHTVVYGSTTNTHALEHVNGLNGLMNIISKLNRM